MEHVAAVHATTPVNQPREGYMLQARVLTVHAAFQAGGGEEESMTRHLSNRLLTRLEAIDRAGDLLRPNVWKGTLAVR